MGAMMPDIQKTLAFDQTEIKFIGDGSKGTFEGYASVLITPTPMATLFCRCFRWCDCQPESQGGHVL
jgi:hypothetical protein